MSSQVTRRTQSERTETAKARLRLAALELFALKGYDATQLADVSVRAGFSRGLAQYHYGDKTTLTLELLDARMRRDLHADLLICPPATAPDDAWARLMKHLDVSWEHYRQAHSTGRSNLAVRGAIQLQQAASMATDERMAERLNSLTAGLVSRVAHILGVCREGGVLRADVDVQAVAVLYVHTIWGLASALFANPRGEAHLAAAIEAFRGLLSSLRLQTELK